MLLILTSPTSSGSSIDWGKVITEIVIYVALAILAYVFYKTNHKQEKREIAATKFYSDLQKSISCFREALAGENRLYIHDASDGKNRDIGNIFTIIYNKNLRASFCSRYHPITQNEFDSYKICATDMKKTITESDNSIHPCCTDKQKWQDSLAILLAFCNFIIQVEDINSYNGTTNEYKNEDGIPKHTAKCQELVNAMDYIEGVIPKK